MLGNETAFILMNMSKTVLKVIKLTSKTQRRQRPTDVVSPHIASCPLLKDALYTTSTATCSARLPAAPA